MTTPGKRLIAAARHAREMIKHDAPTYGLCEECHEAPAIGLTRDGRYLCDGCLFQEETR